MEIEFKGHCVGVSLKERGVKDDHILVTLLIEDDESWFEKDFCISSFWLPELISKLEEAQKWMKHNASKDGTCGFKFRK